MKGFQMLLCTRNVENTIIERFAEWATFSALRRAPKGFRSREVVYRLIRAPEYESIIYGTRPITCEAFDKWHRDNIQAIIKASNNNNLPVGWAAKIINVYLKVRVYIPHKGRSGLIDCIHPPIDNELVSAIRQEYSNNSEIVNIFRNFSTIKGIESYPSYIRLIRGCRLIAQNRSCRLIEVEQLWDPTSE